MCSDRYAATIDFRQTLFKQQTRAGLQVHQPLKSSIMTNLTITYSNDDDRAYGLAGMAISLAALNALDRVASVSLDSDGPMVNFSHEYYFCGSPSISPKATWNNLLQNFHLTSAMVVSNVLARSIVRFGTDVPENIMSRLRHEIEEEGRDSCSLETDESDEIFNRVNSYMRRIFRNERLHPAIEEFVRTLSRRRSLSGMEIADELQLLQII